MPIQNYFTQTDCAMRSEGGLKLEHNLRATQKRFSHLEGSQQFTSVPREDFLLYLMGRFEAPKIIKAAIDALHKQVINYLRYAGCYAQDINHHSQKSSMMRTITNSTCDSNYNIIQIIHPYLGLFMKTLTGSISLFSKLFENSCVGLLIYRINGWYIEPQQHVAIKLQSTSYQCKLKLIHHSMKTLLSVNFYK